MNQKQIKALETKLWDSANTLRATSKLTAADYKDPVLGLILLRYAQNRFEQAKERLEKNLPSLPPGRTRKPLAKGDFKGEGAMFIPEAARYDYLANLPESEIISDKINEAMELIENDNPALEGVLPRNYQEMDGELLRELIRVFNSDEVKTLTGDIFGRIYEFFLMKFSMDGAGAQEGGEFFTPPSLVELIVNLIQPDHGIIHDPACGSGGMFVQTGHFLEENSEQRDSMNPTTFYGTELKANNVRLAKMNLAIHGLEGTVSENNSFYADPHRLLGQCDFVMANPPFNVKKVDKNRKYVKQDPRLFGKPLPDEETEDATGTDKDKKAKKAKAPQRIGLPKADNGNYLWIQYFYHYLNDKGRAGFVMASSATDAGNTEKLIRQELIETRSVDCIVSVGNNFFYTRSLPCHVWFLDKGKRPENRDKILMIDARNTYRTVTSTINDYSPGQLANFSTIMSCYRGDDDAIETAHEQHESRIADLSIELNSKFDSLRKQCQSLIAEKAYQAAKLDFSDISELTKDIEVDDALTLNRSEQLYDIFAQPLLFLTGLLGQYQAVWEEEKKAFAALSKDELKQDSNKAKKKELDAQSKQLKALTTAIKTYLDDNKEELANLKQAIKDWRVLGEYFPDGVYQDVEGLCKIVDLTEVAENDFSLTPGRYVGYRVEIDEGFDYQKRITEINAELSPLNNEANQLLQAIQSIRYE